MEDIGKIVADNLKSLREDRGISLDKLSDLTGVSKSMLGQIERQESNPTIQTIWKIATGLKISLTSLIVRKPLETRLILKEDITPIIEDESRFKLYPVFPFDSEKNFEILNIEMSPKAKSYSEAHDDKTQEYILVNQGIFKLVLDGKEYVLEEGDSIAYYANRPHSYHNNWDQTTKATMIIYYLN